MHILPLRLVFALVCMIAALSGCSFTPVAKDGEALKPAQGLVAFHVASNADVALTYVDYASESTFGSRWREYMVGSQGVFSIKAGDNYYLAPLKEGEYMFSKLIMHPRYTWLQATNRFKVSANKITYIGHIRINVKDNRFGIKVFDRELEMREYLLNTFPRYFETMDLQKNFIELSL